MPKSSQIQPPGFFRSPRSSHGVYVPRPNVLVAHFHIGRSSTNDALFSFASRGLREPKSVAGGCVYLAREKGRDLSSPFLLLSGGLHLVSTSSFAFFHRVAAFNLEARLD